MFSDIDVNDEDNAPTTTLTYNTIINVDTKYNVTRSIHTQPQDPVLESGRGVPAWDTLNEPKAKTGSVYALKHSECSGAKTGLVYAPLRKKPARYAPRNTLNKTRRKLAWFMPRNIPNEPRQKPARFMPQNTLNEPRQKHSRFMPRGTLDVPAVRQWGTPSVH